MSRYHKDNTYESAEGVFLMPETDSTEKKSPPKIVETATAIVASILVLPIVIGILAIVMAVIYRVFIWIWP